jgi:autotransporter-associated beta strand protein
VTTGSIEGEGDVFLGANNLTVGSNNLSTTFSGVIQDGGFGGSLTKIGTGTLDLTGANTYTGITNINRGVLQVDGSISSNTFVNHGGALAGSGTVNGNVTNNNRGMVRPGDALGVPGVLTVGNNYTQTPSAALVIQIAGADAGQVSVLDVRGNANLNGFLDPVLLNGFVPAIGQSFTFLNYASFTGFFSHIQNDVFDNGRKRWLLIYQPTGAVLIAIKNGPLSGFNISASDVGLTRFGGISAIRHDALPSVTEPRRLPR